MSRIRQAAAAAIFCALAWPQTGGDAASVRRMRADLEFLCSDLLEGRVSLSRSADISAAYIAAEFERLGLTPVAPRYLQPFPLVAFDPDPNRTQLRLVRGGQTTAFAMGTDFRGAYWREVALTAPLVFAGYGITAPEYGYDDYAGIDVQGKVALVFDHEPQEADPRSVFNGTGNTIHGNVRMKWENARRHGAVALLVASEPLRKHSGAFGAGSDPKRGQALRASAPRQALEEDSIPVFQVSDSTATQLLSASGKSPADLASEIDRDLKPASMTLPGTSVELTAAPLNLRRGTSLNAVGLLEGSDPALRGETVIIDAHYDHLAPHDDRIYPGANDNGSGTVGVMELARMFAGSGARPRRSLLFIVFGSEEEVMLGSYYYVNHPLRPLETTRAVLNLDMIGRDEAQIPQSRGVLEIPADTTNEINIVGGFYSPDLYKAIVRANDHTQFEISTKHDRDHNLNTLFRCDHLPFLLRGIPAVWIFGGFHPGYHEPSDTVENLDFAKLDKTVRLTYWTARAVADAERPPRFEAAQRTATNQ